MTDPDPPNPSPFNAAAIRIFVMLAAGCLGIVMFFGFFGVGIMNLLARHDPNPRLRDRAATRAATREVIKHGLDAEIPEENVLARDHGRGPGRINCVIMGAKAEKAGHHAEAYLWFALDARSRGMNDAVKAYEDEALRLAAASNAPDRIAALNSVLGSYSELSNRIDEEYISKR